jgi:DMSO reductase anchor subunit
MNAVDYVFLKRHAAGQTWAMRLLPAVTLIALTVSVVVSLMQGAELASIHSSQKTSVRSCGTTTTVRLTKAKAFASSRSPNFLGKLHDARLADARLLGQLLGAQMPGMVGLRQQKIRQLFVALGEARVSLANTD